MNDRIEELIVAYLHRGITPEQEGELFEACRTNSEVSTLLRQHLTMSLKIRRLRDEAEVPLSTRNALLERINSIPVEQLAGHTTPVSTVRDSARRFGWAHLLGTAFAGAAAVAAFFLLMNPGTPDIGTAGTQASARIDTVVVTHTETVTQYRDIVKPVYIVRNQVPAPTPADQADQAVQPQETPTPGITDAGLEPEETLDAVIPAHPAELLAQTDIPASGPRAVEPHLYLQQYNAMLASLEKVRLTPGDRIRN